MCCGRCAAGGARLKKPRKGGKQPCVTLRFTSYVRLKNGYHIEGRQQERKLPDDRCAAADVLLEELDLKNPGKVESNLVSPCVLRLT